MITSVSMYDLGTLWCGNTLSLLLFRDITLYEREFIRNLTRLMFDCDLDQMPVESLTSWSQKMHPDGHFKYASCLTAHNAMDRFKDLCQRSIRDKCLGPVESSLQNNCHIFMERVRFAASGKSVEDLEGFPPIQTYLDCSKPSRDAAKACLPHLLQECKARPIKVSKILRGNMSAMIDILQDFPKLKVIHLIRDPRAIIMSRQNWYPRRVPLNFSIQARRVCTKMAEDIRRRQEIEKRYPGLTMEVVYENIATNPTENIAAMYKFAGINMTESTISGLNEITSKSRDISEKWRTQIGAERKKLVDAECQELYKITPYDP